MKFRLTKREAVMGGTALSAAILTVFACFLLNIQSKRFGLLMFVVSIPAVTATVASDRLMIWLGLTIPANPANPLSEDRYRDMVHAAIDARINKLYDDAISSGNVEAAGFIESRKGVRLDDHI
jgi:hypothetical protein